MKSPFRADHLLPKLKTGNAINALPSSLPSIQIPECSGLTVTGTSVANSMSAYCQVSVIVNGIKPYQRAVPTGHGGANDYSTLTDLLLPHTYLYTVQDGSHPHI
jgi:hypothetical protein